MISSLALVLMSAGCGATEAPRRSPILDRGQSYLRPTEQPFGQWHYETSDVVERYDSAGGRFAVHFTRAGPNAVPALDNDTNNVPDYVQLVATTYEAVATTYQDTMGYRGPIGDQDLTTSGGGDNGGDGRFDIYLLDFALNSDGHFEVDACLSETDPHCLGHILQENDFAGYGYPSLTLATRLLASHEYFHAIQAAYTLDTGSLVSEGTAVWGSEAFDPSTSDLRYQVRGYLENTDRSLDVPLPGPVDPFSYGSSLFFQFLSERFDPVIIRTLWEHLEPGAGLPGGLDSPASPRWLEQTDLILKANYSSSFEQAFEEFAVWNLSLAGDADASVSYARGETFARAKREPLVFPVEKAALRLFHASIHNYQLQTAGRQQIEVALVDDPDTREDETAGVHLLGAARLSSGWSLIPDASGSETPDGRISLDATGASELLAVVINTERAGASKRPGLCIGDPTELATCLEHLTPSPVCAPPQDCGGGTDGGSGGTDGGVGGGGGDTGKHRGCSSAGGSATGTRLLLGALMVIALASRRRSRSN